jgi:hypothetical protein
MKNNAMAQDVMGRHTKCGYDDDAKGIVVLLWINTTGDDDI